MRSMANPINYYRYGFLVMIFCLVFLISPTISAGDDEAGPPLGGKNLTIGLPYNSGYPQFVDILLNSANDNQVLHATGYSIDVFEATIAYLRLNHSISFEYRAFITDKNGSRATTYYDDLVRQIYEEQYDAVVGDVTILENRLEYADFTLPYKPSNVKMLVKIRHDPRLDMWIFVRPFSWNLWLSIAVISIFIGGIILFMERNVKEDSTLQNSSCSKQFNAVSILWLPVVHAVFPKRESLGKNSSRFVLVMWLILVFVLMQSYTASLSSILTINQLQPQYLSENDVVEDANIKVGCKDGSFVGNLLVKTLNISKTRVKNYNCIKEYKEALDKGSDKGGVDAIFDEAPYLKIFLQQYGSNNYAVVGTRHNAGGFGLAFRKGSNLTASFSKAILNISESNKILDLEEKYFGSNDENENKELTNSSSINASPSLTAYSFVGLFILIGTLSLFVLAVSESHHIWRKPVMLAITYSHQFLSPSSTTRISPLEEEEGSTTAQQ